MSARSDPGGIHRQVANIPTDAELVTVEAGMVDFRSNATLGALYDTTPETFHGAVYATIMDILAVNPKRTLVFITPFATLPTKAVGNWLQPNDNGDRQEQFVQAIRDVCGWCGVPVIDVSRESGIGGPTAALYLADGTHLNPAGGMKMAEFIYDRLALIRPFPSLPGEVEAGDGVWTLRPAAAGDLSATGVKVTGLAGGHAGGVAFDRVAPYFFSALWLNGDANAVEFVSEPTADNSLWLVIGEGEAGWVAAGDFGNLGLQKLASFEAGTGDVTFGPALPGRHAVDPNSAGMRWRVARRGTLVEIFQQRPGDGLWLAAVDPIDLSTFALAQGRHGQVRLGVLASHGTARDVRIGAYV